MDRIKKVYIDTSALVELMKGPHSSILIKDSWLPADAVIAKLDVECYPRGFILHVCSNAFPLVKRREEEVLRISFQASTSAIKFASDDECLKINDRVIHRDGSQVLAVTAIHTRQSGVTYDATQTVFSSDDTLLESYTDVPACCLVPVGPRGVSQPIIKTAYLAGEPLKIGDLVECESEGKTEIAFVRGIDRTYTPVEVLCEIVPSHSVQRFKSNQVSRCRPVCQ